jgi:hypothetical protein
MSIDPIAQAIEVIKQCWKEPEAQTSDIEYAIATAMYAQQDNDWLVASVYTNQSKDSPKVFTVILWRSLNSPESTSKIQIKPVLVHWDVELEKFVVVTMSRLQ